MSTTTQTVELTPEQLTLNHISRVSELMSKAAWNIMVRGGNHDSSKLIEPEKTPFEAATLKLKHLVYDSPEYKESLKELGPALALHYKNNDHHPEHFENGIDGMDLFMLMELCADWKASSERRATGDIQKSLEINTKRFNISPQLASILKNTFDKM